MHVPSFDGKALSFLSCKENVIPPNQIPTLGPQRLAANLLLRMTDIARKVVGKERVGKERVGKERVGKERVGNNAGVQQISRIRRGRFAPDAIDST